MTTRSIRYRLSESNNLWPGFVDVLATLLIVIIFILMVFTVSQIYLSDAISGRDKALDNLRKQIDELSKILVIETEEKEQAFTSLEQTEDELSQTEENLRTQELYSQQLQSDISKKESELFIQDQNILALSDQIKELLAELRIVAKALETYEGVEIASLETSGLGERINKALATRIDQLNQSNKNLDIANNNLALNESALKNKIEELNQSNKNLDIANNNLALNESALKNKIEELNQSNKNLDIANNSLALNESALKNKIEELNQSNKNLDIANNNLAL